MLSAKKKACVLLRCLHNFVRSNTTKQRFPCLRCCHYRCRCRCRCYHYRYRCCCLCAVLIYNYIFSLSFSPPPVIRTLFRSFFTLDCLFSSSYIIATRIPTLPLLSHLVCPSFFSRFSYFLYALFTVPPVQQPGNILRTTCTSGAK